jgi:FdhD protein
MARAGPRATARDRVRRTVLRVSASGAGKEQAAPPAEVRVRIVLNGAAVAELPASPGDLPALAVGHLVLDGRIADADAIAGIQQRKRRDAVEVHVRAAARRPQPLAPALPPGPRLDAAQVHALMKGFLKGAEAYREGGGVHTSAIATMEGEALFASDVGKVNTVDRLAGLALREGFDPHGALFITTGRLTGAMVGKALALGCPVLLSHSGPTSAGLALARGRKATLLGYARGDAFSIYAGPARIALPR